MALGRQPVGEAQQSAYWAVPCPRLGNVPPACARNGRVILSGWWRRGSLGLKETIGSFLHPNKCPIPFHIRSPRVMARGPYFVDRDRQTTGRANLAKRSALSVDRAAGERARIARTTTVAEGPLGNRGHANRFNANPKQLIGIARPRAQKIVTDGLA
jgi:hypothetical protein